MKVYFDYDTAHRDPSGVSDRLYLVSAGTPFEMPDAEALGRIGVFEADLCVAGDPNLHAVDAKAEAAARATALDPTPPVSEQPVLSAQPVDGAAGASATAGSTSDASKAATKPKAASGPDAPASTSDAAAPASAPSLGTSDAVS